MMELAFLGLGSNLGNRLVSLRSAVDRIAGLNNTRIANVSSVYETEPYGVKDQPDFLNAVIGIETDLSVEELQRHLKSIEQEAGRIRRAKWGPREIDIDILFFGSRRIEGGILTVPHPGVAERRFVLEPLAEVSPDFIHPVTQMTVSELLHHCPDRSEVRKCTEPLIMAEEK